jgi:hypothetical protein
VSKLYYLASPYTKYPAGHEQAFIDIAKQGALLAKAGIYTLGPIVHSHPIALYGQIDNVDHDFWLKWDFAFLDRVDGMIICEMEGWDRSKGVDIEIKYCMDHDIPIYHMTPGEVPNIG